MSGLPQRYRRAATLPLLAVVVLITACVRIPAQYRTSRLAVQKSGVATLNYTLDGSERRKIFNAWGSYNRDFTDLLGGQPAALEEARRGIPYNTAAWVVMGVGSFYSIGQLVAAMSEDHETLGGLSRTSARTERALGVMLGTVLTAAILGGRKTHHMYSAVGIFNAGLGETEGGLEPRLNTAWLMPQHLGFDPVDRRIWLGWRLPIPAGF
jgi:hypothetical protein